MPLLKQSNRILCVQKLKNNLFCRNCVPYSTKAFPLLEVMVYKFQPFSDFLLYDIHTFKMYATQFISRCGLKQQFIR
jgi:hypothetical protein